MAEEPAGRESESNALLKSQKALANTRRLFKTNVPFLQKWADNHLIVGYIASTILPIVGFVAACILVRYKGEYTNCMVEHFY